MKSKIFRLIFAILLTLIALLCAVMIVTGLIYNANPGTADVSIFYNNVAIFYLNIFCTANAVIGILLSVTLMVKRDFFVVSIITSFICTISLISVLMAVLI